MNQPLSLAIARPVSYTHLLYGFYDDGERFAFFSRAVLETLFYIDFTPDIINCNDWQTRCV